MEIKTDISWRVYLCFIGIAIIGIFVLGRAFYIQQVQGNYWREMGNSMQVKTDTILAERGSIYSEDGNMLSTSIPVFDIYIDFAADGLREKQGKRFKDNIDSLSISLANLFADKTAADYKKQLQLAYKNKDRYYSLKKKVSFEEYRQLRSFPLVRLGRNKSGFIAESRDKRINPYGLLANRTIGLSRNNATKNVGLELTYDSLLRGVSGQRVMRYAAGLYMPVMGGEVDPINGKDIITTLDTYIQDVAENALMKMLVGNKSLHGTAIVMETATGKIKAIANLGLQPDGTYIEDLNYGIGKATEPGSVFKLATLLSLLEDKHVTNESLVECGSGIMYFSGLRIKDSHLGTGTVSVKEAFMQSSNVAFAKLANDFYGADPSKFTDHLSRFRLDKSTGIDIIASSGRPTIKKPHQKSWGKTTLPFMAHGYEEMVTPLHMLMLYNAVANNGKMMRPYLVNAVRHYGVDVKLVQPEVLEEKICSKETLVQAQACLKAVVDSLHGTGHKILFDSMYSISGKTGTAVTALDNKGYNKGNKIYQSSFMGYFPSENPRYSMAVVIQNTKESIKIYGADVSGVVFKEIADKIYGRFIGSTNLAKINTVDTFQYDMNGMKYDLQSICRGLNIVFHDSANGGYWRGALMKNRNATMGIPAYAAEQGKTMPSVVGLGLKDAVYLLENKGLKVEIRGRGRVVDQSLMAGMQFNKGQKVQLLLN
jgi:cell division protein FtsI (penicillin-binding protein 3)